MVILGQKLKPNNHGYSTSKSEATESSCPKKDALFLDILLLWKPIYSLFLKISHTPFLQPLVHWLYYSEISAFPNIFMTIQILRCHAILNNLSLFCNCSILRHTFCSPCTRPNALIYIFFSSSQPFGSLLWAGRTFSVKLWLFGEYYLL